jgi:hypothetical protein
MRLPLRLKMYLQKQSPEVHALLLLRRAGMPTRRAAATTRRA